MSSHLIYLTRYMKKELYPASMGSMATGSPSANGFKNFGLHSDLNTSFVFEVPSMLDRSSSLNL